MVVVLALELFVHIVFAVGVNTEKRSLISAEIEFLRDSLMLLPCFESMQKSGRFSFPLDSDDCHANLLICEYGEAPCMPYVVFN